MSVRIEHLIKSFGPNRVLDNLSFETGAGEFVTMLGPTGCGKTTTLRIIAGLDKVYGGKVYINGRNVDNVGTRQRNIGFVFQQYALFKYMNIIDNVAFGLMVRGVGKKARYEKARRVLSLVGMEAFEYRFPHTLSGGQMQRVALARALCYEPSLLLLDEPFGALDAKIRKRLALDILRIHKELKITTIFVTHNQEEAMELGDRVIVMNRGRIEQAGPPQQIYNEPASKFVASFVGMVNIVTASISGGKADIGPVKIPVSDMAKGLGEGEEAVVIIRPEDIEVSTGRISDSVEAEVVNIRFLGPFAEIDLAIKDIYLKAAISKAYLVKERISAGSAVWVKLHSYKVFPSAEGIEKVQEQLRSLGYIE